MVKKMPLIWQIFFVWMPVPASTIGFWKETYNHDQKRLRIAKKLLAKEYEWMENEIIK